MRRRTGQTRTNAAWALATTVVTTLTLGGCEIVGPPLPPGVTRCEVGDDPLDDNFERYEASAGYRCGILTRDLVAGNNAYGLDRRTHWAVRDAGWDILPERDPATRPFTLGDVGNAASQTALPWPNDGTRLSPLQTPATDEAWIALGRRVFFEYPLRVSSTYEGVARLGRLEDVGFIADDGALVGLRAFIEDDDITATVHIGQTCAQCHASRDEFDVVTGQRANRAMDIGSARVYVAGFEPGALPPELDSTATADYDRLGAGRADVLGDGTFNPYAFPDFGGLVDVPYLHHNGNWLNTGVATLAMRCETLFVTSNGEKTRPPRVLMWALAKFIRSLPASRPLDDTPAPEASRGEVVFSEQGCVNCHVPPLYTSAQVVQAEDLGTDASAALSPARYSGGYRVPTLRGIGRLAPYLHHGIFDSLEDMFDPARLTFENTDVNVGVGRAGHQFGLTLDAEDRAALLAFLRSI